MKIIAQPSVQSLFIRMSFNDELLATGTAFVVHSKNGDPYLITNLHNFTGRNPSTGKPLSKNCAIPNKITIVHNRKSDLGAWIEVTQPLLLDETPLWIEHPVLADRADFAALKLTNVRRVALYPYDLDDLGPDILLGPADPVSVIGFPFGLTASGHFGIWATGFLASEPSIDYNDLPIQLIDCRTRQGQSGSPVVAYRSGGTVAMRNGSNSVFGGPVCRFVGIYSGRVNAESDLGMVWKASAIAELVRTL